MSESALRVRISRPARNAMQSGQAKSRRWRLVFEDGSRRTIEPLMGWTSVNGTLPQVTLWFETKDEAIAYATRHGYAYTLDEPKDAERRTMAYSDNFKAGRIGTWTH